MLKTLVFGSLFTSTKCLTSFRLSKFSEINSEQTVLYCRRLFHKSRYKLNSIKHSQTVILKSNYNMDNSNGHGDGYSPKTPFLIGVAGGTASGKVGLNFLVVG